MDETSLFATPPATQSFTASISVVLEVNFQQVVQSHSQLPVVPVAIPLYGQFIKLFVIPEVPVVQAAGVSHVLPVYPVPVQSHSQLPMVPVAVPYRSQFDSKNLHPKI